MDFPITPPVPNTPPAGPTQNNVGATAEAGATATVQSTPDNVVTAATETAASNEREDDASKRESRPDTPPTLDTFQNLQIKGLESRLGFDDEKEVFFLEILQPNTDNVIQRIPSESLVEFLDSQYEKLLEKLTPSISSNNFDRSI